MKCTRLVAVTVLCFFSGLSSAQTRNWPLKASKHSVVTLKLARSLLGAPKTNWLGARPNYKLIIETNGTSIVVNGRQDWQDAGWPAMLEFTLSKVDTSKTKTEVELKRETTTTPWVTILHLQFQMSPELVSDAFERVVFEGSSAEFEKSSYYRKEVADRLLPKIFSFGKLSELPREQQLILIKASGYEPDKVSESEYKGRVYISFTIEGESVYNTLQLGQTARVARVVQDSLLSEFKDKYRILAGTPGIDGVKLKMEVAYKDFTETLALPRHDILEIYTTLETIKKFNDAEITSQQLLDESIVLVNGDRVQVSLNQAK